MNPIQFQDKFVVYNGIRVNVYKFCEKFGFKSNTEIDRDIIANFLIYVYCVVMIWTFGLAPGGGVLRPKWVLGMCGP